MIVTKTRIFIYNLLFYIIGYFVNKTQQILYINFTGISHSTTQVSNIPTKSLGFYTQELQNTAEALNNKSTNNNASYDNLKPNDVKATVSQKLLKKDKPFTQQEKTTDKALQDVLKVKYLEDTKISINTIAFDITDKDVSIETEKHGITKKADNIAVIVKDQNNQTIIVDKTVNNIKLVNINYSFCWLYILIIGIYTLFLNFIIFLFNIIYKILIIIIKALNYIYYYFIIKFKYENNKIPILKVIIQRIKQFYRQIRNIYNRILGNNLIHQLLKKILNKWKSLF